MTFLKQHWITISCLALISGILFYGFYDEKIHIDYSIRHEKLPEYNKIKQSLTFYHLHNDVITTSTESYFTATFDEEAITNIINLWLSRSYEQEPKLEKIMCHSTKIKNNIYYCSFNKSPFTTITSLYEKYAFCYGLVKTIDSFAPETIGIQFLINHSSFEDEDLDFSLPWSINFFK